MIGLDTVLVGWSFRHYLLTELIGSLNTFPLVYKHDEDYYSSELIEEIYRISKIEYIKGENKKFPFWTEVIDYLGHNWKYTSG